MYIFTLRRTSDGEPIEILIGDKFDYGDKLRQIHKLLEQTQQGQKLQYLVDIRWPGHENAGRLLTRELDMLQEAALFTIQKARKEKICHKHLEQRWYQAMNNYIIAHGYLPDDKLQLKTLEYGLEQILKEYVRMKI